MAKLPDAIALGERPKPEPLGRSFHMAGVDVGPTSQVGEAVTGAGEALFKIGEKLREAREASRLSDTLNAATTELSGKALEFAKDPDFKTSPERFKKLAGEIGARYEGQFGDEFARQTFRREYGRMSLGKQLSVLATAARMEGESNVATLDSNLDVMAKSAASAQNPLERSAILRQAQIAIETSERAGWIGPADAEKRRKVFAGRLDHASVLQDIAAAPGETATKLGTDPAYAENLDPVTRQTLRHTAEVREAQRRNQILPVEAREDAEAAMALAPSAAPGAQPASYSPDGKTPAPKRQTALDVRSNLGEWVVNAERLAEKRRPGDAVYRDMVVNRVKNYVSTIVAAQEGEQRLAHSQLIGALGGVDGKPKPVTQDDLFARPGMQEAFAKLDPHSQAGILGHLRHNALEAEGRPERVNARVVNELFPRLFLDASDPNAIYKPEQLTPFIAKGLTPQGHSALLHKMEEIKRNPDGRGFASDVERVNRTAQRMLARSIAGSAQPEIAEEAAMRFRMDLDKRIEEVRKTPGGDVRSLITPGSKDYVLSPERVMSYMTSGKQAVADAAGVPPRDKMVKLDPKDPEKSFNELAPGTWYIGPNGQAGRKPDAEAAPKPASAPTAAQFSELAAP